jgi:beta-lactamase class A
MIRVKSIKTAVILLFVLPAFAQNAPAPKPIDLLKQKLEQISAGVSADWGIYIKSLDTGEEVAINADKVMDTMSAIKIPLLVDVYRQVDAGNINTSDRIVMKTADKRFGTGVLRMMGRQQFRSRIPRFMMNDSSTPHKTGDFPPFIANDVGLVQTPSARVVVVFFSAHHRGFYSELEDAIGRMSEQVWGYFNYREKAASSKQP